MEPRKHGAWSQNALRRALNWLIPARCRLCDMPSHRDFDLCLPCEGELPWLTHCCHRCALPTPANTGACARCLQREPAFDACIAACAYTAPVSHWVHAAKYRGDFSALTVLSHLLWRAVASHLSQHAPPDLVCPMPLHWRRRWHRGFNQAEELARHLGKVLPLIIDTRCARRVRATPPQRSLDARARRKNLAGAFSVESDVAGMTVAIVDDVLTTGASADALARALKNAGAKNVSVWCCARTPASGSVQ